MCGLVPVRIGSASRFPEHVYGTAYAPLNWASRSGHARARDERMAFPPTPFFAVNGLVER